MKYEGKNGEYFEVLELHKDNMDVLRKYPESALSLIWFDSDSSAINIDFEEHTFHKNDIICITEFHKIGKYNIDSARLLRFNPPFYCILDHDSEVGCKGILYYGASALPIIRPNARDTEILETVWKMLAIEMKSQDALQLEMLQMMLKRILILCTRIYKSQVDLSTMKPDNVNIIREFNFLVEKHFKELHTVGEYATLLNKSPKTLSNLFKKSNSKTPLQTIQERIILESERMLVHTDFTVSEIGYELGFRDIQSYSRFFKKKKGLSPLEFKRT